MASRFIATWAAGGLVVGAAATGIVAATGAGGGGLHRLPIGSASASSTRNASGGGALATGSLDAASVGEGSASTKIAAGSSASSDVIAEPGIARMYRTEFEVVGKLPALDGQAAVWQLGRSSITSSQVSELAAVFALSGEPVKAPDYDAWLVGPNDGTKPMLSVDGGAGHRWYFNDPGAFPNAVTCVAAEPAPDAAPSVKPGAGTASSDAAVVAPGASEPVPVDCPAPEPPANLPSSADALALAKTMAGKVGLDPADLKWESFGDEYASGATAQLVLNGVVTEEPWLQVSFGGNGKVQWASGLIAMPSKVGDYPRVGTSVALDKLRAMSSGIVDGGVMPLARDAAGTDAATSDVATSDTVAGGGSPTEEVVQTVKLTGVTETLSSYYGSDEVLYLVPSYRFTDAEGGIWPVIALDDKYLASDSASTSNTGGAVVSGGGSSGSGGSSGGAPARAVGVEPATNASAPGATAAIAAK